MPLYKYVCKDCGHSYEAVYSIANRDTEVGMPCTECYGTMIRPVDCQGFKLLGSGWAKDGYATTLGDAQAFERK